MPRAIKITFSFLLLTLITVATVAQKKNARYQYRLHKASSEIKIDGIENDLAWKDTDVATDFFMVLPMDTSHARVRTEVRMTYDDHHIYLMATCYHLLPGPFMVESLRRDFAFGKNDNFLLFIDPFDDQTNGFSFGANAAGAQWDATMFGGGSVDLSWDNKWVSEVKTYDDRWVFEAAIPFKSIRYKKGIKEWGINFSRLDLKSTEKSVWAPVPRQFPTSSLAYSGILSWDQPPPEAGANISIIPYALARGGQNFESGTPPKYQGDFGADAKISLTSSVNLDLTINPDFSQVDVDRQVTNLDRFELFFPERRQFFLENGDLFANFGYATLRPFFSRRIGLGVPIQYGARVSGRINRNWRIGMMDMQTRAVEETGLPVQNFGVVSLQRRVFARSNIGFIFINKQSINYQPPTDSAATVYSQYNRNIGLEYNLASSDNIWTGKALVLRSFSPDKKGSDYVHAANLQYATRKWNLSWQHEMVGKNYNAEVGYVPRKGYIKLNPMAGVTFFPKGARILSHGPTVSSTLFFNDSFQSTDNETWIAHTTTFRTQSKLTLWMAHNYVKLLAPFDPTNSGKDTLATGSKHYFNSYGFEFTSKPQSIFTYAATGRNGGYYANGSRLNLTADIGYRFQPYVSIALSSSYNDIWLPETSGRTTFWLVGPRIDVTLTNKLFFTSFVQYNDQKDNVNLNTRLQWRYKPASDLFIVYTDNYLPGDFYVKNRSLVVKFTYWLSI